MSYDEDEGYVVTVTEMPIAGYDEGSFIVSFRGTAEVDDEMVEVTFGVDKEAAQDIVEALSEPVLDDGKFFAQEPYVLVLVEPWQMLTGPLTPQSLVIPGDEDGN